MLSDIEPEANLVLVTTNVVYLPQPNIVKLYITPDEAPEELTRTAFMVPTYEGGALLANNRRRGVELPGGHRDGKETMHQAAIRETMEEVGATIDRIIPLGYMKMESMGEQPFDWSYPHPLSYQQIYAGRITRTQRYLPNDECLAPVMVSDLNDLKMSVRLLIEHAQQKFYGGTETLIQRFELNGFVYEAWRLTDPNEWESFFEIRFGKGALVWRNYCRRCQTNEDVLSVMERLLASNRRNCPA